MSEMLLCLVLAAWTLHELPFTLRNGETAKKPLPATMPGGIAVLDYDGDGKLDVYLPNSGGSQGKLLRNLGKMKFEDATAESGIEGTGHDFAAAAGDYDGDGKVDILISGLRRVRLYRNQGGKFRDVTTAAGLDNKGRWSVGAVWFDMDKDGDLDLFIVNYVQWDPAAEQVCLVNGKPDFCHPRHYKPEANALFRNNGDGTFTDVSVSSGVAAHKGKGMGATAADFDGDGFPDLFVANDRVFNFFFRNKGNGAFTEDAFPAGVAVPQDGKPPSAMGVDAQDYDNDGRPDLIYTALRDETFPLYRNRGAEFGEATAPSRLSVLTRSMAGWGIAFADLDNDGWKDIAIARSDALSPTGGKGSAVKEPPSWLRNTGGKFAEGGGWQSFAPAMHRGLIAADMDDDGCLDIVLTALNETARILRNPCASGHNWLKVDTGGESARLRVANQYRDTTTTASGYASSSAAPAHFGLGAADGQVEVEVVWRNGSIKRVRTTVNRTVRITR